MLLLISKAHPTIAQLHAKHAGIGRLVVPKDAGRVADTAAAGIPWAADNAAFSNFDEARYRLMLDALEGVPGCRFVVAPDVVADAAATLERLSEWWDELSGRKLPIALAAQDGFDAKEVPWSEIDALFIGGTTEWKMGDDARAAVEVAKEHGLWTHMGRVNTIGRIRYANAIGCDSVDGSKYSKWTDAWIEQGSAHVSAPPQGMLL